jgi:hypothetical protein
MITAVHERPGAAGRGLSKGIPEKPGAAERVPERRVLEIWQSSVQRRQDLVTEESGPVNVIYPGRPNDGRGADLKDAVISTGQGTIKGDIEIHVKSSDWRAHGHHRDPAYNNVVLHVVLQGSAGRETIMENGAAVPTLALDDFTEQQPARRITTAFTPVLAPGCKINPETAAAILDQAGEARFRDRASVFQAEISSAGPGEALYRGMMTALGYSKNKEPMAQLAGLVPLRELEEIMSGAETNTACLAPVQSRLLGTAGLLPAERLKKANPAAPPDGYEIELAQRWKNSGGLSMAGDAWRFFKVRPGNMPVRRIAAVSYLLARYRKQGLLGGLREVLENSADNSGRALEEALLVRADDYWGRYLDFGMPVTGKAPSLIGADRAAEIITNVILPFFTAYGWLAGQKIPEDKARETYRRYRPSLENSLEKHMREQLGVSRETAGTAQKRQGLIYIYKTFCTQGKCGECPLSGSRG